MHIKYLVFRGVINPHSFVFSESGDDSLITLEQLDVRPASVSLLGEQRHWTDRQRGYRQGLPVRKDRRFSHQSGVIVKISVLRSVQARWRSFDSEHLQTFVHSTEQLRVQE